MAVPFRQYKNIQLEVMSKKLELPEIIVALLKAQREYDSQAYAEFFTTDAVVHDEGKDYNGKNEIKKWNEATNKKYRITLEPLEFSTNGTESTLTAMVSGNFDGSPAPIKYNFTFEDNKIKTLNI